MNGLVLTQAGLNPQARWCQPLEQLVPPGLEAFDLFDQNGYDLCPLELEYAEVNNGWASAHRNWHHIALKQPWMTQGPKTAGSVLNHCLMFERKGYAGAALEQLHTWAPEMPMVWKVAKIRPKWGFDFSMDWCDAEGNVFEILHFEWDGFDYDEVVDQMKTHEELFLKTDWDWAANTMIRRRDEWQNLGFFEQSHWKCQFFGIADERFKMVLWE